MELHHTLESMVREADENLSRLKELRRSSTHSDSLKLQGPILKSALAKSSGVSELSANSKQRSSTPLSTARNIFRAAREKELNGSQILTSSSQQNQSSIDALNMKMSELEAIISKQQQEAQGLRAEVSKCTMHCNQLGDAITSAHRVSSTLSAAIPGLQNEIQNLKVVAISGRVGSGSPATSTGKVVDSPSKVLSEEIFQRVHREFNTVVTSVVTSCVKEQNDRIGEAVKSYLNGMEAKHREQRERDAAEISSLKVKNELLEGKLRQLEIAIGEQDSSFDRIQKVAVKAYRQEVQSVLEQMSKSLNECISINKSYANIERPADVEKRVVASVQNHLVSVCSKLDSRSMMSENAVKSLVSKCQNIDNSLGELRQNLFRAETMASHALNVASTAASQKSSQNDEKKRQTDCAFLLSNAPVSNAMTASICPQDAEGLFAEQRKLTEAIDFLESDNSKIISRLNVVCGEVERLSNNEQFVSGSLHEKIDSLKFKLNELENNFASAYTTKIGLEVSNRLLSTEDPILRGEMAAIATDISSVKSEVDLISRSYVSEGKVKQLMLRVLQSDSPIPSVLTEENVSETNAVSNGSHTLFRPVAVSTRVNNNSSDTVLHTAGGLNDRSAGEFQRKAKSPPTHLVNIEEEGKNVLSDRTVSFDANVTVYRDVVPVSTKSTDDSIPIGQLQKNASAPSISVVQKEIVQIIPAIVEEDSDLATRLTEKKRQHRAKFQQELISGRGLSKS